MQLAASSKPSTLSEDAAFLKTYLAGKTAEDVDRPDLFLTETLRRFAAGELIALIEAIGLKDGAIPNILLYKKWIEIFLHSSSELYVVWYNLGIQYGAYGDTVNRIICYQNALALKPTLYQAALNLGLAYEAAGQTDLALATWQKALQPDEARIALLNNSGRVLENLKRLDEASEKYAASLQTVAKQTDVLHHWIGLRTKTCSWPLYDNRIKDLLTSDMHDATRALTALAVFDDLATLERGNALWIKDKMPAVPLRLSPAKGYAHDKLRIGYLSSDYCMHPIAFLVAELFETHDRDRFEIYGYCSTKDDGSPVRRRVIESFDKFVDVRGMSDEQAARAIQADEIDILVDLNGLTLGTRLQILRWRAAPVQVTYLGYNGPIPLPELDYIVADRYVIPPEDAAAHRPKPLYMPQCYQVNDGKLPIALGQTREEAGLPQDKFVFCSFCNTYKVTEEIFAAWMEILRRTKDTVLWLFVDNGFAKTNIKARIRDAGVAEARVIFASRVEASKYRGRLALADLFLDTYPYNAGTTASDALRVGLPLITISGRSFTARMAGSLLRAMDLEDGITLDHTAYVDLAVSLATDKARYQAFRDRVTPERWRETLGDTTKFCRDLESLFEEIAVVAKPPQRKARRA